METKRIKKVNISFSKMLNETLKARLFIIGNKEVWISKSQTSNLVVNKKLGGHMSISYYIYKKIFNLEPDNNNINTIVINHTPDPIQAVKNNDIDELIR